MFFYTLEILIPSDFHNFSEGLKPPIYLKGRQNQPNPEAAQTNQRRFIILDESRPMIFMYVISHKFFWGIKQIVSQSKSNLWIFTDLDI